MQLLHRVLAAHGQAAQLLRDAEEVARRAGDARSADRRKEDLEILDGAFFVLLFAQFEKAVQDGFERLVRTRAGEPGWDRRRGFDLWMGKLKRAPFADRLALLLDRDGKDFERAWELYETRNDLAHGTAIRPAGDLQGVAAALQRIAGRLAP